MLCGRFTQYFGGMTAMWLWPALGVCALIVSGCGKSLGRYATEQLLESDAVDQAISKVNFDKFSGRTVFLDTTAIEPVKRPGFVNSAYVISALRQQMFAAGALLQDKRDDAEFIVEARAGALGSDNHEVVYGIPASNLLSTAASFVPTMPQIPTIPELSLAKKNEQMSAAKIAMFAYHRESKLPYWQSGVSVAESRARDSWFLGAGPFQRGSIYDGTQFAGNQIRIPMLSNDRVDNADIVPYEKEFYFGEIKQPEPDIKQAGHEKAAVDSSKTPQTKED